MAGEVRAKWERFVTHPVFKRYAKYAKEPAALFDSIGEDLASSNQEIREIAFWALVYAMPKLTSILHERETRDPGWRDEEGKDQKMINRGSDVVSDLHRELVVEHRFKISDEYGKDPRRYVNRAIRNRKLDLKKKRKREVLLDYDATLTIPDQAASLEESVIEKDAYEEWKRVFRRILRSDEEFALFETVYIDATRFAEALKSMGIDPKSAPAMRQQFSRARKQAVAERDALLTFLLIGIRTFPVEGKFPRHHKNPKMSEWWEEIAIRSIRPGVWLNGVAADGKNALAIQPLTTGLHDAPAHIFLVAIHNDYLGDLFIETAPRPYKKKGERYSFWDMLTLDNKRCLKYIHKLIAPTSKGLGRSDYIYSFLYTYPTELPRLNVALAEIRDDYSTWLISNSIPDRVRVEQWWYGEDDGNAAVEAWLELFSRMSKKRVTKLPGLTGRPFFPEWEIGKILRAKPLSGEVPAPLRLEFTRFIAK